MLNVRERVRNIISNQLALPNDDYSDDASFVDDLGADSLDTVELVMAFEEAFGIDIPDNVAESITTVAQAISHIESALTEKAS